MRTVGSGYREFAEARDSFLSQVPHDLVPLEDWSRRLGVESSALTEMADRELFPPVFQLGAEVLRVSDSAVKKWLWDKSSAAVVARRRRLEGIADPPSLEGEIG